MSNPFAKGLTRRRRVSHERIEELIGPMPVRFTFIDFQLKHKETNKGYLSTVITAAIHDKVIQRTGVGNYKKIH